MHKYYFKIKKNNTELEFSTDNLEDFDTKVLQWVDNICQPQKVEDSPEKTLKRMDFIEIRDLVKINQINKPEETTEEETKEVKFEEILEESIKHPKINLDAIQREENEFERLLNSKNPKNSLDYLIITSFYMFHIENIVRFSIKQVNRRLVPLNKEPITHKVLQEAIDNGFIELIMDFTGMGDTTEYSLTQRGEEYYYNEL